MIQNFDSYGLYEPPNFILCNPDKTELYSLGQVRDRKYSPRFNALGTVSFIADAYVDGVEVKYYDSLQYRRLVYLEDIGYFMISKVKTSGDGIYEYKEIECESLEVELVTKKISSFKGTYKFYDLFDPSDTLMGKILTYLPGWSMGGISSFELTTKYRTFDVSDSTIYNFLMQEVSEAYQCIFIFDTINKTINAYTTDKATTVSDIYLSYDNLIKNLEIEFKTNELVTALSVYGGGGLSINVVNPLGTDTIYDFSYFTSTEWMSEGLYNAIIAWDIERDLYQSSYANLVSELLTAQIVLAGQEAELAELETELAGLNTEKSALIAAGSSLSVINSQITTKINEITAKQVEIDSSNNQIEEIIANLTIISDHLSFTNEDNFTSEQLTELSPFVIGSTYHNENIIQTDSMSASAIQTQGQYLFDQAEDVLAKISQPRYEFSIESANFIFLEEFQPFISDLALGSIITIETREDEITSSAVLLGFDLNYDDPEDFSLIFGNRLRLDDSAFALSDLLSESYKSFLATRFNSEQWANWNENYKNDVSTFITSALNTTTNNLISGSDQSILIDQSGIRVRKSIGENEFDPHQLWMNNGVLAFSSDGFESSRLALGQIEVNGQMFYGLVADVVIGHLIASNELVVTNEEATFEVTGDMVRIDNGYLTLTKDKSIITLDPDVGITIDKKLPNGSLSRQMYIDADGNLIFEGDISGASGTFTGKIIAESGYIDGWEIRDNGLWDSYGNYIRSDGKIRLGKLWIDGDTAIFSGDFYAENLRNQIQAFQIGSVNATTITSGVLSGIDIFGCNIYWGGDSPYAPRVAMTGTATGVAEIFATKTLSIRTQMDAVIDFRSNLVSNPGILIYSPHKVTIGGTSMGGDTKIDLRGNIWANGEMGATGIFPVGDNLIQFTDGIMTGTSIDGNVGLLGSNWTLSYPAPFTSSGITINSSSGYAFGTIGRLTSGGVVVANNTTIDSANATVMYVGGGKWLLFGIAFGGWSLLTGKPIYLSSSGGITHTVPTASDSVAQILGVAISPSSVFFNPSLVQVELM